MKKTLPLLLILFSLFFADVNVVNAQVATDSATASDSTASGSADASGSGDLELPETLPETGAHDIFFFFAIGLVLIAAGFSGLASRKQILQELD